MRQTPLVMSERALLAALEETRAALGSDTATMLLLDESGTVLEPFGSVGLTRTPRTAARVPLGQGFAGGIALTRQPRSLVEVNAANVLNPVLLEHGVRSLLGVPIVSGASLIGVLHVGTLTTREFSDDDLMQLLGMAERIAATWEERLIDDAHSAALVLQRSLLPARPRIGGLDIAGRYIPAEGDLGGDWYDVFELPDGSVGIVMGDVVGHGLGAAVVMGRLRSALRAYALESSSPAEVLYRLDRKISHFEDGILATVLYAVTAPPFDVVTFSTAGHWAPMLARPGRPTTLVDLVQDSLLGLGMGLARHDNPVALSAGDSLCLFTDGLVERRGDPVDEDLTSGHMAVVMEQFRAADDAETACSRLVARTIGDDVTEDDVALLVLRHADRTDHPLP